jgi:hypothetical protein
MLQFKVDSTFSRWQDNALDFSRPRNLVDLCDILSIKSQKRATAGQGTTYLSHELIEEPLTNCMPMSMPLQTMDFAEGMETFDG